MHARPAKPERSALIPVTGLLAVLMLGAIVIEPKVASVVLAGLLCLCRAVAKAPEEDEIDRSQCGIRRVRITRSDRPSPGR